MANSTITLTTSIALIILFTIAIVGFAVSFANENDAAVSVADDSGISSIRTTGEEGVKDFRGESEETHKSIVKTRVEPGSDVVKSPGSFSISWGNLYDTFGNILTVINTKVFGGDPSLMLFFTALMTILGFMFALYIIKTWRGNP